VDNPIYVPVNKVIEIETSGADVIHSFAMPEMGVKMDAVPGRLNKTWFKATKTGVFYGQCSELCGSRHAYMPIELHVVTDAEYAAWLASSKKEFAALENDATRVASK
jgi:cytochrome c oxidase subunit 2